MTDEELTDQQLKTYIENQLDMPSELSSDLTVPSTIDVQGRVLDVAWISDNTDVINDTNGSVTRPAEGEADVDVTITVELTDPDDAQFSKAFTFIVTVLAEADSTVTTSDIFISEYVEGSGNNKAIEIYNPTDSEIDLSNYIFKLYANGRDTTDQVQERSGSLAPGETKVYANSQADQALLDKADVTASYPNNVANYNGDDAIELIKNGTVIDVFGVVGSVAWEDTLTSNHTLVRKSSITGPSTTWSLDDWDDYPQDTFDHLGSHTID